MAKIEEMKDEEILSRMLIYWSLNREVKYDPEFEKECFIARVLRRKLEAFNIDLKVPDPLCGIIMICTGSNPGVSQLMLKEIMTCNKKYSGELTPLDFSRTYPTSFPLMSKRKWEEHFEKEWDAQKDENGDNLCDTPDWWKNPEEVSK